MSWNYRVMAKKYPNNVIEFDIYEVYYNDKGVPDACSMNPVTPGGYDDVNEVKGTLELMMKAVNKPILWYGDDFPQEYKSE